MRSGDVATPPGPRMWQTYRRLRNTPLREFPTFLFEMADRYGSVVSFRVPWRRFYLVSDPAAIKDVLVTYQHEFVKSEGTRALGELLGAGLVTSEEPLHRRMRRIVQPAFHRQRIASYTQTMRRYAEQWEPPAGAFDMHAEMMELTLRIASTTLFGVDAGAQADRVSAALHDVVEVFPEVLGPFGAIKRRLPFPATRRFRRSRAILDEIVMDLIAQRRSSGADHGDALSMLLASRDAETGAALDDRQVRDEVMTLFVAGHETTANLLLWVWYLLAKNDEIGMRLHTGLQHGETPLLEAILSETLRLYPPVWILGRDAKRDVVIAGGWRIRRGAALLISQLVIHRNARYFPEPERFLPERWLDGAEPPPFAYLPFGAGSRKCLGDQFAWAEARDVLASIATRFRFDLCDPQRTVEPLPIVTLRPSGPVLMRVRERGSG